MTRTRLTAALALALPLLVGACGGSDGSSSGSSGGKAKSNEVAVKITDAGCEPPVLQLPAGATTFTVQNDGAARVTEFEILDGDRVLGEAENVAPGLTGQFVLTLRAGEYTTYCPGGSSQERGTLTVNGAISAAAGAGATAAVAEYRAYVEEQVDLLAEATDEFVAAVKAGDVERAKALYGPARVPYERIEPVAESFGTLDPKLDAREGDVPAASWTGFHPLERSLWVLRSAAGTTPLADGLVRDVGELKARVQTMELEAAQIANGAVELLGEVSKSKITGEEERYSHIDLVDFQANVEGARAAFDAVRPIVDGADAELAETIDARFDSVFDTLEPYRRGDGFVSYTALESDDTRKLSQTIDALAEPLSQVGRVVVEAPSG